MHLKKIQLQNFRCYQTLDIDFHVKITVLVANNGQGKTSILDAVRIALWPYVSQFDLSRTQFGEPANTITIDDVRILKLADQRSKVIGALDEMARQFPSSITAIGSYSAPEQKWQRYRDSEVKKSQTKDDVGCRELKKTARRLQVQVRNPNELPVDLPVFGYYGTGRLWKEKRLTSGKKSQTSRANEMIRTFAYQDCLDPASSFRQFEDWFTSAYIKVMQDQIRQIEHGATFIDVDPALKMPVKVVQDAVNEVLKPVGWQNLQYSETYDKSLVLKHSDYGVMKVTQLSDGIQNMLAMIADIAYRCVLLNGHLGESAAKKSKGIVLIDEVDMHLHPQWQQTVIESLQKAFPCIQFIVTTHSPQVLSTVPSESIRVIKHEKNIETNSVKSIAEIPSVQSRGVASADVMAELQFVDTIPNVKEAAWLTQYKALILENEHTSTLGIELKQKITKHFGETHREWLECERLIRLEAMKAKLPRRINN